MRTATYRRDDFVKYLIPEGATSDSRLLMCGVSVNHAVEVGCAVRSADFDNWLRVLGDGTNRNSTGNDCGTSTERNLC